MSRRSSASVFGGRAAPSGALADETFPLAARSLRVLLRQRRDRRHIAMIWLAPQPAEKGALEQLGVQAIGLRPPVLA